MQYTGAYGRKIDSIHIFQQGSRIGAHTCAPGVASINDNNWGFPVACYAHSKFHARTVVNSTGVVLPYRKAGLSSSPGLMVPGQKAMAGSLMPPS